MSKYVEAAGTPVAGLRNQARCQQQSMSSVRLLEDGEQMGSEREKMIANIEVAENGSLDQSENREIPSLNYVNIKRTGVIPEARYEDHLKITCGLKR